MYGVEYMHLGGYHISVIFSHSERPSFIRKPGDEASIRESVDSLCRDGADTPMPPYIGKAFTRTNFEDLSLFRYMIMVCE